MLYMLPLYCRIDLAVEHCCWHSNARATTQRIAAHPAAFLLPLVFEPGERDRPGICAKVLVGTRLRVTRAIAARIKNEFGIPLRYSQLPGVFFVPGIKLVARIYSSNALWGCGDEICLSVEYVTVGFLWICRQYCCD